VRDRDLVGRDEDADLVILAPTDRLSSRSVIGTVIFRAQG